jgi:hypothetical protein
MPNHVHLLLGTPDSNLSAFMGRLLTTYAVYFNWRHRRSGHLRQGRFKAQLVEGDEYLLKLQPVHPFESRLRPTVEKHSREGSTPSAARLSMCH